MPQITYDISLYKNRIALTASEFTVKVFFGALPIDPITKQQYSYAYTESLILTAQQGLEDAFSVVVNKALLVEKQAYTPNYQNKSLQIPLYFPIEKPLLLLGGINGNHTTRIEESELLGGENSRQTRSRFLKVNKLGYHYGNANYYSGYGNYGSYSQIPGFWTVYYTVGYDVAPLDFIQYTEKLAELELCNLAGEFVGLGSGIASKSISLDGLSQSVSGSARPGFADRIKVIQNWFEQTNPSMQAKYNLSVLS